MKTFLILLAVISALTSVPADSTTNNDTENKDAVTDQVVVTEPGDEDVDYEDIEVEYEADKKSEENVEVTTDQLMYVIRMVDKLKVKCSNGDDMGKLTPPERAFYLVNMLELDVTNGGFSAYFYNSYGNYAKEMEEALRTIGAPQTADIYNRAYSSYGEELPEDIFDRRAVLSNLQTDSVKAILSECDKQYYAYPEDLYSLLYNYAMDNQDNFIK